MWRLDAVFRLITARWLLCLCLLGIGADSLAQGAVWRIRHEGSQLFLGATIHLLQARHYPLPEAYDRAYAMADRVVLETDMSALKDPAFAAQMLQQLRYPQPAELATRLRQATLARLVKHLQSNGQDPSYWLQYKPAMVAMQLTQLALRDLGFTEQGVDKHYFDKAKAEGKPVVGLERPDQQLAYLVELGEGMEDRFIAYSLDEVDGLEQDMAIMLDAWQRADMALLQQRYLLPMVSLYPEVYGRLVRERNRLWLPQIEAMLNDPGRELVLVGALHLVGADGLLDALKQRGFEVTPF